MPTNQTQPFLYIYIFRKMPTNDTPLEYEIPRRLTCTVLRFVPLNPMPFNSVTVSFTLITNHAQIRWLVDGKRSRADLFYG